MPIARSTGSKLLDGIRGLLVGDALLIADVPASKIFVGPHIDGNVIRIQPPQINILFAPNFLFEPQATGTADVTIGVAIFLYEKINQEPSNVAMTPALSLTTPRNGRDRIVHIQKLLMEGNDDNNLGRIVNPDDPTNPIPTIKYLNVVPPKVTEIAMGRPEPGGAATTWAILAAYQTREDALTRERV